MVLAYTILNRNNRNLHEVKESYVVAIAWMRIIIKSVHISLFFQGNWRLWWSSFMN